MAAVNIKELKQSVDIVDIIGPRLNGGLKKTTGGNFIGMCHVHADKTPSLTVSKPKQHWKCFACGAGGDVIDFLTSQGMTTGEAIQVLKGATGAAEYMAPKYIPQAERPKWTQIKPVPPGAPKANFQHYELGAPSKVWNYQDENGALIGHVLRFNDAGGKDKKQHRWLSFCTDGSRKEWRWQGFDKPKPLYNLPAFKKSPKKAVLLVEGEKAADAAHLYYGDKIICATWPGGVDGTRAVDWTPLTGRTVYLWPDNDLKQKYAKNHPKAWEIMPWEEQPGNRAMLDIHAQIKGIAKKVLWVKNSPNFPDKWDIADAHFTKPEAEAYIKLNSGPVPGSDAEKQAITPPPPVAPPKKPKAKRDNRHPFRILGFEKQETGPHRYHFYSYDNNTAVSLRPDQMKDVNLCTIADLQYWENTYGAGRKGIDLKAVVSSLVAEAHRIGPVSFNDFRGRGAWLDDGHIVVHAGNRLIVDGQPMAFKDFDSEHIYEQSRVLDIDLSYKLNTAQAGALLSLVKRFNWERGANAYLLAGWIVISPVCGALAWRPHIWVTGPSGSGKSTIMHEIIRPMIDNVAYKFQGSTTESGIRQTVKNDAVPVLFDEADADDRRDMDRIQQILGLSRASSSATGDVAKGTSGQSARNFTTRACFAFASINLQVSASQDRNRVSILSLRENKDVAGTREKWEQMVRDIAGLLTPEYAKQLQARTISMLPQLLENIKMFAKAAAVVLGQQRLGDQVAPMLAGAYSLQFEGAVTFETALEYVKAFDWTDEKGLESTKDEVLLLQHLMETVIFVEAADGVGKIERNIGEMIKAVISDTSADAELKAEKAADRLRRMGIKVDGDGIIISNTSIHIKGLLSATGWAKNWNKIFMRLDGAEAVESTMFTTELRTRAVRIPLALVAKRGPSGTDGEPWAGHDITPPPQTPTPAAAVQQPKAVQGKIALADIMGDDYKAPTDPLF